MKVKRKLYFDGRSETLRPKVGAFSQIHVMKPFHIKIDSRIELIPFRPDDFNDGGMLTEEINRTGKRMF